MDASPPSSTEGPRGWFGPGLKRLARSVPWWGYALPFALAVIIAVAYGVETLQIRPKRRWQEIFGIVFTATATAGALLTWLTTRRPFKLWATALLALLLSREIHFTGTSAVIYPGLLIALVVALKHWDSIGVHLTDRRTAGLVVAGFLCYAVAVCVDQRWVKLIGVPGEKRFHVPMEESMELIGHLLIAAALLLPTSSNPPPRSPDR
jgi:hypothetical protein